MTKAIDSSSYRQRYEASGDSSFFDLAVLFGLSFIPIFLLGHFLDFSRKITEWGFFISLGLIIPTSFLLRNEMQHGRSARAIVDFVGLVCFVLGVVYFLKNNISIIPFALSTLQICFVVYGRR